MDLSPTPFDRAAEVALLPGDLTGLMIAVARRQGESRTAAAQARLCAAADPLAFQPLAGSFDASQAATMRCWTEE